MFETGEINNENVIFFSGNALLRRLVRIGVLDESRMKLDYVLGLKIEDFLERRLQTQVFKLGLAKSIHHARVLIRQRHIRFVLDNKINFASIALLYWARNIYITSRLFLIIKAKVNSCVNHRTKIVLCSTSNQETFLENKFMKTFFHHISLWILKENSFW